jgi:hypothetical protein
MYEVSAVIVLIFSEKSPSDFLQEFSPLSQELKQFSREAMLSTDNDRTTANHCFLDNPNS